MAIAQQRASERRASRYFRMRDLELLTALSHSGGSGQSRARGFDLAAGGLESDRRSRSVARRQAPRPQLCGRATNGLRGSLVAQRASHPKRTQAVLRDLDALADPEAGEVRIGAPEPVTAGLVGGAIVNFTQRYPRAFVQVVSASTSSGRFTELRNRAVDLMVGRIPRGIAGNDVAARGAVYRATLVVCGSQSRWARSRSSALRS